MRRLIGTVLTGLGMFLVVMALAMYFVVPGVAVKFPLNTYTVATLVGHDVSYFSSSKVTELSGVTMRITDTTQGDGSAGTTNIAVYNTFSNLYDETNKTTYEYTTSRLPFDRKTGELVNCCDAAVGGDTRVHLSGLGVLFPLGTKQQNYQVFNTTLNKPVTARYAGQTTFEGLTAYKFVSQISPTRFGTEQVPGSLIGSSQPNVTLGEYFQGTTTWLVNPTTGVPLAVTQQQHVGLRDASGTERLVLLDGTMRTTPSTEASLVHTVKGDVNLINLATKILPLIALIVGLIALIVGIALATIGGGEEIEEEADQYAGAGAY